MHRRRKILIPIIIGLVIITIGVVIALIAITKTKNNAPATTNEVASQNNTVPKPSQSSKPEETIDLTNVGQNYSDAALSFADGLSSSKKMEEFLEVYVDHIAYVASTRIDTLKDFYTVYDAVEKEEGEKIKKSFDEMVSKNDSFEVIKMTDVEELDDDKIFSSTEVTLRNSEDAEATFKFTFYDGDTIIFIEDSKNEPITNHSDEFSNYFIATEKDDAEEENTTKDTSAIKEAYSKMGQQERDIYNGKLMIYEGKSIKGSEVNSLLDVIIANNEQFVGTETKFVAVYTTISEYDGSAKLESVSKLASPLKGGNNSEANVKACSDEIKNLKNKIDADSFYSVEFERESGFIVSVNIGNV